MYNKYLIKYNYSDGTKPINFLIYNYIFLLYKNKNDIFFFKKILIITLDNKLYLKILNKIIKILKKLSNTNYKKLLITKKIKKKLFITYKEINIFSKIILNNFIRYYKKIPIYNFNIFFYYLYKKKINYYFSKIYFFKKKNLLIFLNYIFKKKNINTDYIKKIFLKKIYLGYYYIIKYLIKNIKKILNNNKFLYGESKNNINHKYIYKKITYYILKIKNIKKTIYNNKKKFYLFLKKKQINIHSFIYNDIYKLFEKKINYTFFKKVYFNNLFLNKRLKKNLKNNIFYSKTQNNFIKK
ncbi:MAG: hypothetical protein NHG00_00535, partial [Candidatus Shikimatogenerans sp. JK-2022]|nr:hypothetical protein [Candidatus Shikimatogenerans bostrichidophilus]